MFPSVCGCMMRHACRHGWCPHRPNAIPPSAPRGRSDFQKSSEMRPLAFVVRTVLFCFGDSTNHEEKLVCQMKLKGSQSKLMPRCTNSVLTTEACCTSSLLGSATMLSCQAGKKAAKASASEGRKEVGAPTVSSTIQFSEE